MIESVFLHSKFLFSPCLILRSLSVPLLRLQCTLLTRKGGHFILAQKYNPKEIWWEVCAIPSWLAFLVSEQDLLLSDAAIIYGCCLCITSILQVQSLISGGLWSWMEVKVWGCWNMVSYLQWPLVVCVWMSTFLAKMFFHIRQVWAPAHWWYGCLCT